MRQEILAQGHIGHLSQCSVTQGRQVSDGYNGNTDGLVERNYVITQHSYDGE